MSARKYFSPFYDTGRRRLGVSPATVDALLAARATAELSGSNAVVFRTPDGRIAHQATYRPWRRQRATGFVNMFNERAREAGPLAA
jgi:hypothetical protein